MNIETRLRAELTAWADELGPDAGPDVTAASLTDLHHRRLRHRAALLAAAVAVVLVAVAVPYTLAHLDRSSPAGPASLYDLPTRGSLAGDEAFLADAVRLSWKPGADWIVSTGDLPDPPVSTRHVVWAHDVPGGKRWVLVAGKNTAIPGDDDAENQTDLGAISPVALALFAGPAGAPADELTLAEIPRGQTPDVPFAAQDPESGTLLVVAAPGDAIEVSPRPTFQADGTATRAWDHSVGRDGVAVVQVGPLAVAGSSPAEYRVFRDSLEISGARGPDVLGAGGPAVDLSLAAVHGPLISESDAQWAAAQLVGQLGPDSGDPDAIIVWQGEVPGPDDGGGPATVTVATVTAPSGAVLVNALWSRPAGDGGSYSSTCGNWDQVVLPAHWPAEDRTYAFSCSVTVPGSASAVTSFVIAAPRTATSARLYWASDELVAEVSLVDGVAVLPADQTQGQRPAVSVEVINADPTKQLPPVPVLGG
jgi:hypothetical protein